MSKYRAVKTTVDNIVFDSKREAARYQELKLLFRAGKIQTLELQKPLDFIIEGKKIFTYRPDFIYFEGDKRIIEDVKGVKTPVYRLKKKLIEAQLKVQIRET